MTVEQLGNWVDVANCSERVNDLMRQSWTLLDEVGRLLGDPDSWDEVRDLLAASQDIDDKVSEARDAEQTEQLQRLKRGWEVTACSGDSSQSRPTQ